MPPCPRRQREGGVGGCSWKRWRQIVMSAVILCGIDVQSALARSESPLRVTVGSQAVAPAHGLSGDRTARVVGETRELPAQAGPDVAQSGQPARPSFAQNGQSTTAEPAQEQFGPLQAHAYGVNLDPLSTCLFCTSAQAGPKSSQAEARAVRLAGEPVAEGQIPANGYDNGAVFMMPANGLLSLAVADWNGDTTHNGTASRAHSRSALAELALAGGGPAATVGESRSDAVWSGSRSRATSESDGARVDSASERLDLVLLHSEGSSEAPASVYLLSVNGWKTPPSQGAEGGNGTTDPLGHVALLETDSAGAAVGMVSDGKAQRVVSIGTTWVGSPSSDPEPLQ
jgi:hypothetical protein